MKPMIDLVIIGGGAAGMTAAVAASSFCQDIVLLEGKDRVGKKLLATGNGRCNYTNRILDHRCYYDADAQFLDAVLGFDANERLIAWMSSMGIESKIIDDRVYPHSEQASSVLDVLRMKLDSCHVHVKTNAKVQSLKKTDHMFEIQTLDDVLYARKVILAAGSKAAPKTGSDGSGYVLARQAGLSVIQPLPALTSIKLDAPYCKSWNGVRCDGTIAVMKDGRLICSDTGQLQLTSYGVSGIPAFQISRYVSKALNDQSEVMISISFLPGEDSKSAFSMLKKRREQICSYRAADFLLGLLPKNLAVVLIKLSGVDRHVPVGQISDDQLHKLTDILTGLTAYAAGTGSFDQAQTCTGGVDIKQINPLTMECRQIPGLYVAGEIMDVDGICGGYNLQWAFSTGAKAGRAAGRA